MPNPELPQLRDIQPMPDDYFTPNRFAGKTVIVSSIVNVGSIAGLIGLSGNPAYSSSKHAVTGLTRNAALDYAPYGIRVNSVNMAATDSPMI